VLHSAVALIYYDCNCACYTAACQGRPAREHSFPPPPSASISTLPMTAPPSDVYPPMTTRPFLTAQHACLLRASVSAGMATQHSVVRSSRHACFASAPPAIQLCASPANKSGHGQRLQKVLRPHARRLAHQHQAPRPNKAQVQGDEGPCLREGGDTVSEPAGSRAGGGVSHGRVDVL
jgi:hypothetical protein